MGLEAGLLAALETLGYEEPTPIQREAVPPLLSGRDVLGQAAGVRCVLRHWATGPLGHCATGPGWRGYACAAQ